MKLTLVVPCFNEGENIIPFFSAVETAFMDVVCEYEVIFVNDGSKDTTKQKLMKLYKQHMNKVSVINFSRNFGKEAAVLAGLKRSTGDYVSIIDADLQQNPKIVVEMIKFLENHQEYDVVAAYQEYRIEGKIISGVKNIFYKMINKVSDIEFYPGASDFRTFRRTVVEAILSLPEYFRFSKGIFSWVGFDTYYMPYVAEQRNAGKTKWSLRKLIKYAIEGFLSFTTFPLKLATYLGIFFSMLSILYMIIVIIQKIFFSVDIPGYPTIVVLILLLGGIQLVILGIIGEYLARDYIQGKNRPIYIEKEYWKCQNEKNNEEV